MTILSTPRRVAVSAAATLIALTTACGSTDDLDAAGNRTIVIGAAPVVDFAPVWHAMEEGYFEEEGLSVETRVIAGGAEAIPAVLAGDVDVIFSAYPAVLQARQRGLDISVVMGSNFNTVGEDQPYGLWTRGDSGVETTADLEGRTIAVNTLGSSAHLMVAAMLGEAGLEPGDYDLLEVPLPEVAAAIDEGLIDAGWVAEPGRTQLRDELGGRFVGSPQDPTRMTTVESLQRYPHVGYVARSDQDPEVIESFRAAMERAMEEINDDPQIARDLAAQNTEIPSDLLASVAVSTFEPVTVEDLRGFEALMVRHGLLDEPMDELDDLVLTP